MQSEARSGLGGKRRGRRGNLAAVRFLGPLAAFVLGLAVHPSGAHAGDGVVEINQTCAVQTGCFSGDTPGFPVTINGTGGRSYRFSSDLVVPNENTSGIVVTTSSISIDLAGFEIAGPVLCFAPPSACSITTGTGNGIEASATRAGISVHDGTIRGMGGFGIQLGIGADVRNLRVHSNRTFGIIVDNGSTLSGSTVFRNGFEGVRASSGTSVIGNSVYQNGDNGIRGFSGATISGNSVYFNGGDGIEASFGVVVQGNSVNSNLGFGLNLGSSSGYRENVIGFNIAGTVTGTGVSLGNNLCNGLTTCP